MAGRAERSGEPGAGPFPDQRGLVSAVRPEGGYDVLTLAVPSRPSWDRARPGQLLVVPGDPTAGVVLPRVHWLAGVDVDPLHGTTVQIVLTQEDSRGWPLGTQVRLLGPLGRGFALPTQPLSVVVVAHEDSAAPVRWLVALLRERGCAVHVLLSADDPDRRPDPGPLRRTAAGVVLSTSEDLPAALTTLLGTVDPPLVLATGPAGVVRLVAELAAGRVVRVAAVDPGSAVVCGTGICGVCDLFVPGESGPRRVRPCLEGPVVPGEWLAGSATEVSGAPR